MQTSIITKTVKMRISERELFDLFVRAVYGDAKESTDKQRTFYRALGHLIGISDKDAVAHANNGVKKEHRITVTEFRRWLPTVFAAFAGAIMLEANDG